MSVRATLTVDPEADTSNVDWLIRYNNDDDNENGIEDYLELDGEVANEDDLQEVLVSYWLRDDAYEKDFLASFSATNLNIWTDETWDEKGGRKRCQEPF
jgi:hypothetical protein